MIRINLIGQSARRSAETSMDKSTFLEAMGEDIDDSVFDQSSNQKDAIVNLLLLLIPFIALYAYQVQRIPALKARVNVQQQRLSELQTQNQAVENIVEEIKVFKEEQERLMNQVSAIQRLSDGRMIPVRAIEALQDSIPERMWLDSLTLNNGQIQITGRALTDFDISSFMEKLGNSAYISNVSLGEAGQETTEIGSIRTFVISATLEEG